MSDITMDKRHGISVGIERTGNHFFLTLKAIGKLTHADYEVITPMLDAALESAIEPRVKAFVDGTELDGWEARAAWDDFKIGMKHGREFEKIAILGNKRWQQMAAKVGSWFVSGEVKFFYDSTEALSWLNAE